MARTYCVALTMFVSLAVMLAEHANAGLVIGTFDSTRASTANLVTGNYSHSVVSTINALYPGTSYTTFSTITPAALSGVDILMIASDRSAVDPITALSASEQTAMLNFVKAGGRALILADAWDTHVPVAQSMVGPFGLTVVDDGFIGPLVATPTVPASPIIHGPYGTTAQIKLYGAGIFTDLGPYATGLASEDVTGKPVLASIPAHALSPTSGRVVLYTDTQMFIDDAQSGYFSSQTALFKNTMNYLVVPEPSSWILGAAALAAFGLAAARRRTS